MAKYQVGDQVRVRSDLELWERYTHEDGSSLSFHGDMVPFLGKIVTIRKVTPSGKYVIEGCHFIWTTDMFEFLDNKDTLLRTMVVAWEMGDMEWYWELAGRLKELEVTC